ncbi:MAG TPA: hypothetical protein DCS93_22335 [Microscillaceae bacterium]|nr:hypothetical protein [Microscillaceae bacterium]
MKKIILILSIWALNAPMILANSLMDHPLRVVADTGRATNEAEAAYNPRVRDQNTSQLADKESDTSEFKASSQKKKKWKKRPASKRKAKGSASGVILVLSIFFILIGIALILGWLNPLWFTIIMGLLMLLFGVLALISASNGKLLAMFGWGALGVGFFELFRYAIDLFLNGGSLILAGGSLIVLGVICLIILRFISRYF